MTETTSIGHPGGKAHPDAGSEPGAAIGSHDAKTVENGATISGHSATVEHHNMTTAEKQALIAMQQTDPGKTIIASGSTEVVDRNPNFSKQSSLPGELHKGARVR